MESLRRINIIIIIYYLLILIINILSFGHGMALRPSNRPKDFSLESRLQFLIITIDI